MKRKLTKREDGRRLNEEGRTSPLEVFQIRMEYHLKIAQDEMAKGADGSPGKIVENLQLAHQAGDSLAPYRHPRLQATAVAHGTTSDLEELLREIAENDPGPLAHVRKLDSTH